MAGVIRLCHRYSFYSFNAEKFNSFYSKINEWPHCDTERKGPPRPNFTCLQGNKHIKVFLHSLTDNALLESHSKGATQNTIECANSLMWQRCLKETFCGAKLWRLQQLGFNNKKSVRRLYDIVYLPLSGQTFNFLHNMDQRSIFYNYLLLHMQGLPLTRRLSKRRMARKEGFGGWGWFRGWRYRSWWSDTWGWSFWVTFLCGFVCLSMYQRVKARSL